MTPEKALRPSECSSSVPEAMDVVPEATLVSLFGPEMKHLQLSTSTLQAALVLRAEQERTKQEQIRLEIAARNFLIIELATKNDVPPHLIPTMCVGTAPQQSPLHGANVSGHPTSGQRQRSYLGASNQPTVPSTNSSLHGSPYLSHLNIARNYEHPDNASLVPPANFRIGTGSTRFTQPQSNQNHRRPRSPAKIGAAAVANLAGQVPAYAPTQRTLPLHQRHFSMPLEALPSSKNMERSQLRAKYQNPPQFNVHNGSSLLASGEEASGKVSSMQVRPSPAQPLYKQTKNSQVPSQESMTSFQHVIQFHHWKPENPTSDKFEGRKDSSIQSISTPRQGYLHKRHKSNEMTVDLLSDPAIAELRQSPHAKIEDNDQDISMTKSDSAAPESLDSYTEARRFTRNSNRGNVDILSTRGET